MEGYAMAILIVSVILTITFFIFACLILCLNEMKNRKSQCQRSNNPVIDISFVQTVKGNSKPETCHNSGMVGGTQINKSYQKSKQSKSTFTNDKTLTNVAVHKAGIEGAGCNSYSAYGVGGLDSSFNGVGCTTSNSGGGCDVSGSSYSGGGCDLSGSSFSGGGCDFGGVSF